MDTRSYVVSSQDKPDETITGSFSFGAFDAARKYVKMHFEGFSLVSCKYHKVEENDKYGLYSLYRAEAINFDDNIGAVIWVREL